MAGLPVTIRLLDPPLHEFLPKTDEEIAEGRGRGDRRLGGKLTPARDESCTSSTRCSAIAAAVWRSPTRRLRDAGPRHLRGRHRSGEEDGRAVVPEIMVPLVGLREELDFVKARIDAVAREAVMARKASRSPILGRHHDRAAARRHAGRCEIAEVAEFFSFGTNDLTQTTFGISRDDAGPS
jgi:pyruvate,orthophosphate dikinase